MTALEIYKKLTSNDQDAVAQRAVVLAGHPADTAFDDVIDHEDHPALVEALREWWRSASAISITETIDSHENPRVREIAIVLCAEAYSRPTDNPSVVKCRRVRLAWVRGEASNEARDKALDAALSALLDAAMDATMCAEMDAASSAAMDATTTNNTLTDAAMYAARAVARSAAMLADMSEAWKPLFNAIAASLRILFPDPTQLDWRDALSRWDIAVAEAQRLMKSIANGELR